MSQFIQITGLNEAELRDLNKRVVARIKSLQAIKATMALQNFSVGDKVYFSGPYGKTIEGKILKLNSKNVKVLESFPNAGRHWNVAAIFLKSLS